MNAKINLTGLPKNIRFEKFSVSFTIITGPSAVAAPKGLPLFGETVYVVQCTLRQYNRARVDKNDHSELIIEGYQEPRVDDKGRPFVAVVATSVASAHLLVERKWGQIRDSAATAEAEYQAMCRSWGKDSKQAQAACEVLDKSRDSLAKFLDKHPELAQR